jgi:glycosyltransferase involved in cell wall biosynthesis
MRETGKLCVAWLISGQEGYGVRSTTLAMTEALARRGVAVPLVSLDEGPFVEEARQRGYAVHVLASGRMPVLGQGVWGKVGPAWELIKRRRAAAGELAQALARLKADALHVRWPNVVPLAAAALRRAGVPGFWHMPNMVGSNYPLGVNRWYLQWQCRWGGILPLPNSAATGRTLGSELVQPQVLHIGADAERFDPARVEAVSRAALGLPDDASVLGVVGRLDPSKGQDRLLQAMLDVVNRQGADLHLLLLGGPTNGAFAQRLRSIAEAAGASERLHLLGRVEQPERYYPTMDVVVNARVDAEPFGLTVVEAMLMGKPLLVHALGGPAETVVDGETGWHVAEPTVEAFATGLERALGERARWAEFGQAGRERALAHFTIERVVERYLGFVRQRCGGRLTSSKGH